MKTKRTLAMLGIAILFSSFDSKAQCTVSVDNIYYTSADPNNPPECVDTIGAGHIRVPVLASDSGTIDMVDTGGNVVQSFQFSPSIVPFGNAFDFVHPGTTMNGHYEIWFTAVGGCDVFTTIDINAKPVPKASIENTGDNCSPWIKTKAIDVDLNPPYSYLWSNGKTTKAYWIQDYGTSVTMPTVYITNGFGCHALGSPSPSHFQHNPMYPTTVDSSGPTSLCTGQSVTLTGETSPFGGLYHHWMRNGVVIAGATNSQYIPTQSGWYVDSITNNSSCGKKSQGIHVTYLSDARVRTFTATSFCQGDSIIMRARPKHWAINYEWFKDGFVIPGETDTIYVAKDPGAYQVQVSNGTCSIMSPNKVITMPCREEGISEILSQYKILVSPNPTSDEFIKSSDDALNVYDMQGKFIETLNPGMGIRFGANYLPGMYFVRSATTGIKVIKD